MQREVGKWTRGWLGRHLEDWFSMDSLVLLRFCSIFFQKQIIAKPRFSRLVPARPSKAKCSEIQRDYFMSLVKTEFMIVFICQIRLFRFVKTTILFAEVWRIRMRLAKDIRGDEQVRQVFSSNCILISTVSCVYLCLRGR